MQFAITFLWLNAFAEVSGVRNLSGSPANSNVWTCEKGLQPVTYSKGDKSVTFGNLNVCKALPEGMNLDLIFKKDSSGSCCFNADGTITGGNCIFQSYYFGPSEGSTFNHAACKVIYAMSRILIKTSN